MGRIGDLEALIFSAKGMIFLNKLNPVLVGVIYLGTQVSGKFIKKVEKRIPLIDHLIEDYSTALEFNPELG